KVRAMGAVALELAHVASGSLDCFFDNRGHLKVTDVAAGKVLIEEVGGRVADPKGNDLNQSITRLERVSILAAGNPQLHAKLLKEVR
ncbi:MAG: inositol monophosphatase family protein, partial [Candidatus Hydrothermarchaeales archaeon]